MARKRSINPSIWSDPKVLRLRSPLAKLLWIGLISQADDEGILTADTESLQYSLGLIGLDIKEIEKELKSIEGQEMAVKYQINGQAYYFLPNWFRHQQVQYPSPTLLQRPPAELLTKFNEYSMNVQRILIDYSLLREDKLSKDKISKDKYISLEQIAEDTSYLERLQQIYPHLIIKKEIAKMTEWVKANPRKGKKLNWQRFVVNWLNRTGGYYNGANQRGGKPSDGGNQPKDSKYGHLSKAIE